MNDKPESQMTNEEVKAKYQKIVDNSKFPRWEDVRKALYTREEIAACDIKVAIIGELIKARDAQKNTEELSAIKQTIARMDRRTSTPNLSTILKVLLPLGKTLCVCDLK